MMVRRIDTIKIPVAKNIDKQAFLAINVEFGLNLPTRTDTSAIAPPQAKNKEINSITPLAICELQNM